MQDSNNKIASEILKLIRKFDFATAKFEELPKEVFRLDRKTLSPMDRAILDGIKFQMAVSKGNEIVQKINYANAVRSVTTGITFTILGFFLISLTYYLNVRFNLGLTIVTEVFAQDTAIGK